MQNHANIDTTFVFTALVTLDANIICSIRKHKYVYYHYYITSKKLKKKSILVLFCSKLDIKLKQKVIKRLKKVNSVIMRPPFTYEVLIRNIFNLICQKSPS